MTIHSEETSTTIYRIDSEDRITYVNDGWCRAAGSDAKLQPDRILKRPLLSFFADDTVQQVHAAILSHARSGRVIRYGYRCDTPDARRDFAMTVAPIGNGALEFVSRLVEYQPRTVIPLLAGRASQNGAFIRMCSWCHAVAHPESKQWHPLEYAHKLLDTTPESQGTARITHGICETCLERMLKCCAKG